MGEVAHPLGAASRVGLDSAVLIYYVESDFAFSSVARQVLTAIWNGDVDAVASTILLSELTVLPYRQHRYHLAARYETTIVNFPNLDVLPVDRDTARLAARIRAEYGFRLPDAIHLATAVQHGADTFITNDRSLQRFSDLSVMLLSDFIH